MPLNKEAVIRYNIIDNCLTNKYKKYPTIAHLIESCNNILGKSFSKSTIQKDIKAMKEDEALGYIAPICFSRSYNGYFYKDSDYTIKKIPLNYEEIEALEFAAEILENYKGMKISDTYNSAVDKVLTSLKLKRLEKDKTLTNIIQQESITYFQGYEHIDTLIKYIKNQQVIEFKHYSYQDCTETIHTVHPYLLKEHRNRWYVVGWSELHQAVRIFGLDRIAEIKTIDLNYKKTSNFNAEEYFKYAIGIYIKADNEKTKVVLKFSPETTLYIQSQPIHKTQINYPIESDGSLKIEIIVFPTKELNQLIMSYGADVQILSPEWLQNEIVNEYKNAINHYK